MSEEWREVWRDFLRDSDDLTADLTSDLYLGPQPADPEDTLAFAVAGAKAAECAAEALDSEWALYTPQQAAVAASALFAQVDAAGRALVKLAEYLCLMSERGDIASPDPEHGIEVGVAFAEAAIGLAGEEAQDTAARRAPEAVHLLAAEPYLGKLPGNVHEVFAGVAARLGSNATLRKSDDHLPVGEYSDDWSCGCDIQLVDREGEVWRFTYGDSSWGLVRWSDGVLADDGTLHFRSRPDLIPYRATAHPAQLAALIRSEVAL